MYHDEFIESLTESLPPVFARSAVKLLLGGVIAPGTLANLASQEIGPPCVTTRGKAIYDRTTFVPWLAEWLNLPKKPADFKNQDHDKTA